MRSGSLGLRRQVPVSLEQRDFVVQGGKINITKASVIFLHISFLIKILVCEQPSAKHSRGPKRGKKDLSSRRLQLQRRDQIQQTRKKLMNKLL